MRKNSSTWVAQAAADSGKPARNKDVLTSIERDELVRLRRDNRQLEQERDILANHLHGAPRPWQKKLSASRPNFERTLKATSRPC